MCSNATDFTRVTAAKPAWSGETLTLLDLKSGRGAAGSPLDCGNAGAGWQRA